MKLNQKGFGVVETLLVVITLTLIVGVSVYTVNTITNRKTDQTSMPTSKSEVNERNSSAYVGNRMVRIYEAVREASKDNQDTEANYLLGITDKNYFSDNFIQTLKAPYEPYEGLRFGCGDDVQPNRIEAVDSKITNGVATVTAKGYVDGDNVGVFATYKLVQLDGDWAVDSRTCN